MKNNFFFKIIFLYLLFIPFSINNIWTIAPSSMKLPRKVNIFFENNIKRYKNYINDEKFIEFNENDFFKIYFEPFKEIDNETKTKIEKLINLLENIIKNYNDFEETKKSVKKLPNKKLNKDKNNLKSNETFKKFLNSKKTSEEIKKDIKKLEEFKNFLKNRSFDPIQSVVKELVNKKLPSELFAEIAFFMEHDEVINLFSNNKILHESLSWEGYFYKYKIKLEEIYKKVFSKEELIKLNGKIKESLKSKNKRNIILTQKIYCDCLINEITKSDKSFEKYIKPSLEILKNSKLAKIIELIINIRQNPNSINIKINSDNIDIMLRLLKNHEYKDIWKRIHDILLNINSQNFELNSGQISNIINLIKKDESNILFLNLLLNKSLNEKNIYELLNIIKKYVNNELFLDFFFKNFLRKAVQDKILNTNHINKILNLIEHFKEPKNKNKIKNQKNVAHQVILKSFDDMCYEILNIAAENKLISQKNINSIFYLINKNTYIININKEKPKIRIKLLELLKIHIKNYSDQKEKYDEILKNLERIETKFFVIHKKELATLCEKKIIEIMA